VHETDALHPTFPTYPETLTRRERAAKPQSRQREEKALTNLSSSGGFTAWRPSSFLGEFALVRDPR
jgi:hypothetical protein